MRRTQRPVEGSTMRVLGWVLGVAAVGGAVFLLYRAQQAESVGLHPIEAIKAPFTHPLSLKNRIHAGAV